MKKTIVLKFSIILCILIFLVSCLNSKKNIPEKGKIVINKQEVIYTKNKDSRNKTMSIKDSLDYLFKKNKSIPLMIKQYFFNTDIGYLNKFDFFIDEIYPIKEDIYFIKYHINGLNCMLNYFVIINTKKRKALDYLKSVQECDSDSEKDTVDILKYNLKERTLDISITKFVNGNNVKKIYKVFSIENNKFSPR